MKDKKDKKIRYKRLKDFAKKLNKNMPKSEIWFLEKCEEKNITLYFTQNEPLDKYIPDFINKTYKIIIEIDGSIHKRSDIREKDKLKDKFYKRKGYTVIRINAFDNKSLKKGLEKLFKEFKKRKSKVEQKRESNKRKSNFINRTKAHSKNKAQLEKCPVCKVNKADTFKGDYKVCSNCATKVIA